MIMSEVSKKKKEAVRINLNVILFDIFLFGKVIDGSDKYDQESLEHKPSILYHMHRKNAKGFCLI